MNRFILILVALPVLAKADVMNLSGYVAGETRGFIVDSQFMHQFNGVQSSLVFQPEISGKSVDGYERFRFVPFVRLDNQDNQRTHIDVREAYWEHIKDDWTLLVGINRVFWGVTESSHLIDIINQTDLVENIMGEDKLGQPMINLTTQQDWGEFSLYVMPWFRERTFPSKQGRLRSELVVAQDVAYESGTEDRHLDLALRYSHYIGDWDFGVYYFTGTAREPRFTLNDSQSQLIAEYDQVIQIGTDVQLTSGAWLWKFEGIMRKQNDDRFYAMVGGFEYTFYQVVNSAADLGVLFEYMNDGRSDDSTKAPPIIGDDDIFIAARLAMNDTQDSELLAGVIIDRNDDSKIFSIEAKRRLDSHWTIEVKSQWFLNTSHSDLLMQFKDDSYLTLRLARYF